MFYELNAGSADENQRLSKLHRNVFLAPGAHYGLTAVVFCGSVLCETKLPHYAAF